MSLFGKKNCDVCGGKIGLFGNRKLDDGNMCKDCAKDLSPYFSERKKSTIEEINEQLAYRKANRQELENFSPSRIFGSATRVLVEEKSGRFIVSRSQDWKKDNPDIIRLDQVTFCNIDIDENRSELKRTVDGGKKESYNPPRYEYEYTFRIDLGINSPWFDTIRIPFSNERPKTRFEPMYRSLEKEANELRTFLLTRPEPLAAAAAPPPVQEAPPPAGPKFCTSCGGNLQAVQGSRFCPSCGAPIGS